MARPYEKIASLNFPRFIRKAKIGGGVLPVQSMAHCSTINAKIIQPLRTTSTAAKSYQTYEAFRSPVAVGILACAKRLAALGHTTSKYSSALWHFPVNIQQRSGILVPTLVFSVSGVSSSCFWSRRLQMKSQARAEEQQAAAARQANTVPANAPPEKTMDPRELASAFLTPNSYTHKKYGIPYHR
jgi:hypothetical protein